SATTIPINASPEAKAAYNPNNTGPMGDLIGGRAGAAEAATDVDLMNIPKAAALTGAGALGAGPMSIAGHVAGAAGLTGLENSSNAVLDAGSGPMCSGRAEQSRDTTAHESHKEAAGICPRVRPEPWHDAG